MKAFILILLVAVCFVTAEYLTYPKCTKDHTDVLEARSSIVICEPNRLFRNATFTYTVANKLPSPPTVLVSIYTSATAPITFTNDGESATLQVTFDVPTIITKIMVTNKNLISDITSVRTDLKYLIIEEPSVPANVKLALGLSFGTLGILILVGGVTLLACFLGKKKFEYESF
ncbi:1 TM domain-containing transmembrane protein [Acrasis kona]|uniref:1 TM domain-containing transmembrane protein n=1 Tax=Acrasis kona TaxID=1008807 RepID=A0AAW2ZB77_9EUKA